MILAALIEYDADGVTKYLGVTDGCYTNTTGVNLEDGLWYPVLSSDVSWSESARHPYQEQGGELVVGDLVLANQSGVFDFLLTADIVGMKVTLKRGYETDTWADMEQIFIARIAGRRFQGYQVLIELENWLAKLAGPVYTETFGSDTPNPQLVGKQIPYVLGKVTQAPVLLYDANNLTYYTASNTSLIGEVAEGGNPTQKWYLDEQPTFNLKGSPTLPITATFEGPSNTAWTTIIDDDLDTWVTGSDTSLTSPYTSQGDRPDGWTLIVGALSGNPTVTQSSGLDISISGPVTPFIRAQRGVGSDSRSVTVGSSSTPWANADAAVESDSGAANITVSGGKTDAIECSVAGFNGAHVIARTYGTVNSGRPILQYYQLWKGGVLIHEEELNIEIGSFGTDISITGAYEEISPELLGDNCEFRIKLRDDSDCDFDLDFFTINGEYLAAPSVHLRRDLSLVSGRPYGVEVSYSSSDEVSLMVGSEAALVDWPEYDDYASFLDEAFAGRVSGSGTLTGTLIPTDSIFNLSYQPAYKWKGGYSSNSVTITRIKIIEQSAGNKSYKTLIPHIVATSGYTTSEVDKTLIDAHADEYGDPELGWLVTGSETADQTLFRLAGSLNGYVWHGLDGKVRSKRLEGPIDPGGTPFVIDSTRADPADIIAYDDDAPNLRRSINALRNWQPLKADDTAGITTTWTEADRAKVTQDWRITRVWESTSDQKDAFERRWPMVASREPLSTALRDSTTAQLVANEGMDTWISRPTFYEVPTQVEVGEFSDVATGETVKVELDYPGLEDTWALVLGRAGTSTPGKVTLTLWVNGITPLTLLAENRIDPRISATRASRATRWNEQGLLEEVGENVLRANYDPVTLEFDGWLIEGSATNQLKHSEDLSQSDWAKMVGIIVSIGTPISKAGVSLDEIVVSSSTAAFTRVEQETAVTISGSGGRAVASALIYPGDTSQDTALRIHDGTNHANIIIQWSSGVPSVSQTINSGFAVHDYDIEQKSDGTYFAWIACDNSTGSTSNLLSVAYYATWNSGGGANPTNAYVGALQLEQGSAPTSYIKTEGTPVTRSADNVLIDGTDFSTIWNDSEGTIVVEADADADGEPRELLTAWDTNFDDSISIRENSGAVLTAIRSGGATSFFSSENQGFPARAALAFADGDGGFAVNGGSVDGGAPTLPSGLQVLSIGQRPNGGGPLNGGIRALYYYPKRLTDEQLQEASTLGRDLVLDKV